MAACAELHEAVATALSDVNPEPVFSACCVVNDTLPLLGFRVPGVGPVPLPLVHNTTSALYDAGDPVGRGGARAIDTTQVKIQTATALNDAVATLVCRHLKPMYGYPITS